MATITATLAPAMGNSQRGRNPYMVEQVVDLTANSINPNGDVVQCLTVPANTLNSCCWFSGNFFCNAEYRY